MSPSVLLLSSAPPYRDQQAREALDAALTSAIFDLPVTLYFYGDGVWQLVKGQHSEVLLRKSMEASLNALPLYDIEEIYVDQQSLQDCQLTLDELIDGVQVASPERLKLLLSSHTQTLSF